jgi:lipopolysaccharide export system protein LptC
MILLLDTHFLDSVRAHTRRVVRLKRGAMLLAIVLIVSVAVTTWLRSEGNGFRLSFEGGTLLPGEEPSMLKPRLQGIDQRGNPFTVTADIATQQGKDQILLTNVQADALLGDGAWLAAMAKEGVLTVTTQQIQLRGEIQLFHDAGYEVRTDAADMNLITQRAAGNKQVSAQGPMGRLTATGFSWDASQGILRFTGPVHLVLYP